MRDTGREMTETGILRQSVDAELLARYEKKLRKVLAPVNPEFRRREGGRA